MNITKKALYEFILERRNAVVATVSDRGAPEAARIYVAVTPELELIFYTLETSRKCQNLRRDPRIAVAIGWDNEQTLQYEGIADEPGDVHLDDLKRAYLEIWPDAAQRTEWPEVTFFRVRPQWIRFSSYGPRWHVDELSFA